MVSWFVCALCTTAAYLPWLPVAWKQLTAVNGSYWIALPASRFAPLRELFDSDIPYSEHIYPGVLAFLILLAFVQFVKTKEVDDYWTLVCGSALGGIMLFAIWYASRIRPILVSRYLIMAVCLCILGISGTVRFLHKYIVAALCIYCCLAGGLRYHSAICAQADRITTKTVDYLYENGTADDRIVLVNDGYGYLEHCVEYYFPDRQYICIEPDDLGGLSEITQKSDGVVWFLDDNGYMEDAVNIPADCSAEACGRYGFGSCGFVLYGFRGSLDLTDK